MQGNRAAALKAADAMYQAMEPMAKSMPEMMDGMISMPKFPLLRFGEWERILMEPKPPASQKVTTALWHYSRAMAYAGRNDQANAAAEQRRFEDARKQVGADAMWVQNKASALLAFVSELLAARLGDNPVARLRKAVQMQDAFVYDEPPAWHYPVRETLGAALLRAKQPAEAEKVFRDGVRRSPKNGRMLFGLMESLKAQNKTEEAAWVEREFNAAWSKADENLKLDYLL
jgi:hypothetical protein